MNSEKKEDSHFNPEKNDKVIALIQQPDGNWKGYANKFGKIIEVRQVDPQIVLQMLLTHNGK